MTNKYLKELGYAERVRPSERWEHNKGLMKGKVESNSAVANLFAMYAIAISVGSIGASLNSSGAISAYWAIALMVIAVATLVAAAINTVQYGVGQTVHRVAALHIADYRQSQGELPDLSMVKSKKDESGTRAPVTH